MNYASIKVLVLVLATGGLIAACASGSDSPEFSSGGGGLPSGGDTLTGGGTLTGATSSGGNAGTTGSASASTGGMQTDGGTSCIPKCNADSDCQNSCAATQTGSNCCDADTGLCYVASTPMCPAPPTDGGVVMPPY